MYTQNKKTCSHPQENDRTASIIRLQRMFTNVRMFVLKNIRYHCSMIFDVRLECFEKKYKMCFVLLSLPGNKRDTDCLQSVQSKYKALGPYAQVSQARPVLSDLGICISLYRSQTVSIPLALLRGEVINKQHK